MSCDIETHFVSRCPRNSLHVCANSSYSTTTPDALLPTPSALLKLVRLTVCFPPSWPLSDTQVNSAIADTSVLGIGERNGITTLGGFLAVCCKPSPFAFLSANDQLLTIAKRMVVADRGYVLSKYKLHKLKDIEELVAEAGASIYKYSLRRHGTDESSPNQHPLQQSDHWFRKWSVIPSSTMLLTDKPVCLHPQGRYPCEGNLKLA